MYTKRKYSYRNSGFSDMRDRVREKEKENKAYRVCPWKHYKEV